MSGRDATGLENENVWNALARKGLIKAEWPHQIALTPEGVAYDTGIADQILHKRRSSLNERQEETPPGFCRRPGRGGRDAWPA